MKTNKINKDTTVGKRKKNYLIKDTKKLLQLFKMAPKKLWKHILTCKSKENNCSEEVHSTTQ